MSADGGGCARSWQYDRPRLTIAKRLQHYPSLGFAAKAGLRSFVGRSTVYDRIPRSRPPVVGSTRPFRRSRASSRARASRSPISVRLVLSARVRSSRPCGARGFKKWHAAGEIALRGEYSMVILSSFPVSRLRCLDTRTKINLRRNSRVTLIQINHVRYQTLILLLRPLRWPTDRFIAVIKPTRWQRTPPTARAFLLFRCLRPISRGRRLSGRRRSDADQASAASCLVAHSLIINLLSFRAKSSKMSDTGHKSCCAPLKGAACQAERPSGCNGCNGQIRQPGKY